MIQLDRHRGEDEGHQGRFRRHHGGASDRGRGAGDDARKGRQPRPRRRRGGRIDLFFSSLACISPAFREGVRAVAERWTRDNWRKKPIVQVPEYPDQAALSAVEGQLVGLSSAGVRRRGAQPQGRARPGGAGRGFPAARRGLRRELHRPERQQHQRQQHPRLPARVPADGGGAHLRRLGAGGEGRPHRRPVRQAALRRRPKRRTARSCRAIAATSSTARSSPPRRARPTRRG